MECLLLFRLIHSYHKLNKKLCLGETALREVTEDRCGPYQCGMDTVEIQIQLVTGVLPI